MSKQTIRNANETPFILRALWFIFFGWHLAAGWIAVAWLLNVTMIGLPLGLWMLNRVPQVLTLKSMGGAYVIDEKSGSSAYIGQSQFPFVVRALYFVVFGWWVSLGWATVGYLLSVTIIGLPFGLIMLNRLPFVTTLGR